MRAAIIGLGNIAWKYDNGVVGENGAAITHLSTYKSLGIKVVAGADPDSSARGEFENYNDIPTFENHEEVMEFSPDVVSITSPTSVHAQHLKFFLKAGVKYIWMEKPATGSPDATLELSHLAEKFEARVLVGFQRRYLSSYEKLKDNSTYGILKGINITYSKGLETNGSHMVDLAVYLFGDRPLKLRTPPYPIKSESGKNYSPSFILDSESNIPITFLGLDVDYHSIDIIASYELGRISVLHGGLTFQEELKIENPIYKGFHCLSYTDSKNFTNKYRNEITQVFKKMLTDLVNGTKKQPLSNLETAYLGQQLISDILLPYVR